MKGDEQLFMITSYIKDDVNRVITVKLNPNYYTDHDIIMIDYHQFEDYIVAEGLLGHYKDISKIIDEESFEDYIKNVTESYLLDDIYSYLLTHCVNWNRAVKVITQMSQYYLSQNIMS